MKGSATTLCLMLFLICNVGCQGPVFAKTYAHPLLPTADARSYKDNEKIWIELKVEHPSKGEQWHAEFENETPEGLKVIDEPTTTRFIWIASQERVRFFGNNGYKLAVMNSSNKHQLLITLRPNYSVVLEGVLGAIH